jgi:ATP-dependent DNA helicase RecG
MTCEARLEYPASHRFQNWRRVLALCPRNLCSLFFSLFEKNLIYQEGSGRGTVYFLAEARLDDAYKALESTQKVVLAALQPTLGDSSGGLELSSGGSEDLKLVAEVVASKKRAPKTLVEETIIELCSIQPCGLDTLSSLLNRSVEVIRKDYLQPMIKDRRLHYLYPTIPNPPQQAYIAEKV